jgi:hypothetical protein
VRLGRDADPEVDPRPARVPLALRFDLGEHIAFLDPGTGTHCERPQVQERHRVAVLGPERKRSTGAGHHPRERDEPGNRGEHVLARRRADVDAAVLSAPVRVTFDVERLEHRP